MDVYELYKPFRNKVALLSYDDSLYVIWAYSQSLQINRFQIPGDIQVHKDYLKLRPRQQWIAEWDLEALAKEVILNGGAVSARGRTLRSWDTLAETVNELRGLEREIYGLYGSSENVLIELIRIAHRQFVWQSGAPNSITTIRYFKIFNQQTIDEVCVDRLGLTVRDIYHCGMAFMGVYLDHPALDLPFTSDIDNLSEEKVEGFLSFTCRTIAELKSLLKSEQQYDDKFAYAYNSLRAYPLIRMRYRGKESIACPLPTLLFWRITGGLYYELLNDPRFPQAYGDSFQGYVGQVIERACPEGKIRLIAEQEYGTRKARKDSVDWIVSDEGSAIFLECKARRLSWSTKAALDDSGPLEADLDNVASAIVQIYKTIKDYIDGQYPHFPFKADRKIYPVIVTLENWHIFGQLMFDGLHNAVLSRLATAKIPNSVLDEMPYSVWPIEELEVAMQIINVVGIQDFMDGKFDDNEMKSWEWHPYMTRRFPEHFPAKKLFTDDFDEIFSGLAAKAEPDTLFNGQLR